MRLAVGTADLCIYQIEEHIPVFEGPGIFIEIAILIVSTLKGCLFLISRATHFTNDVTERMRGSGDENVTALIKL